MSPRLRTALGYGWAALAIAAGLAAMLLSDPLGAALAARSGVKVSPRFSGGEEAAVIGHGAYRAVVRRPFYDPLFGGKGEGFVQVNWEPAAALPARLREEIDVFGSGARGFFVKVDTISGSAAYENPPPGVEGTPEVRRMSSGWAVRIKVRDTRGNGAKRKGPRETHL